MELLYSGLSGSHLYGLARPGSDVDVFRVVSVAPSWHHRRRYAHQKVVDGFDVTVVDFPTWLDQCRRGHPQSLEAMFASNPATDKVSSFRAGYRAEVGAMTVTYQVVMEGYLHADTVKGRRHALRLGLNLAAAQQHRRFRPELSGVDREWVHAAATDVDSMDDVFGMVSARVGYGMMR